MKHITERLKKAIASILITDYEDLQHLKGFKVIDRTHFNNNRFTGRLIYRGSHIDFAKDGDIITVYERYKDLSGDIRHTVLGEYVTL